MATSELLRYLILTLVVCHSSSWILNKLLNAECNVNLIIMIHERPRLSILLLIIFSRRPWHLLLNPQHKNIWFKCNFIIWTVVGIQCTCECLAFVFRFYEYFLYFCLSLCCVTSYRTSLVILCKLYTFDFRLVVFKSPSNNYQDYPVFIGFFSVYLGRLGSNLRFSC